MTTISIDTDDVGQRIRIQAHDGRPLVSIEYDRAKNVLFVWDITTGDDSGPDITIGDVIRTRS